MNADKNSDEDSNRMGLIKAIKTPLGFLTLALLVTEGILGALAMRASGTDFTILIIGMVGTLFVLVGVGADLASRSADPQRTIKPTWMIRILLGMASIITLAAGIAGGILYTQTVSLKQTNSVLGNQIRELGTKAASVSKDAENAKSELGKLQGEIAAFERLIVDANRYKEILSTKLDKVEKDLGEVGDRAAKLDAQYQNARLDAEKLGTLALKREEEISALTKSNNDLRETLRTMVDSTIYADLKSAIAKLSAEHERIKEDNKNLVEKTIQLESNSKIYAQIGIERFYRESNDFQSDLKSFTHDTKVELVLYGVNFYITAAEKRDFILDILRRGISVKFLVFNPFLADFEKVAKDFGQPTENLRNECIMGIEALKNLHTEWKILSAASPSAGNLQVKISGSVPRARMYFFDPFEGGRTFLVPYANRLNSGNLPGFLFKNVKDGVYQNYLIGFRQTWESSIDLTEISDTSNSVSSKGSG